MKAWSVRYTEDWHMLLHAETKGKAKSLFRKNYPEIFPPDFTEISAIRIPELDNIPFSLENISYEKYFSGASDPDFSQTHYNFCSCEICKHG